MSPQDSRQVLALLNQALDLMAAATATDHVPADWRLANELRACRNKLAARIVIPGYSHLASAEPSEAYIAPVLA